MRTRHAAPNLACLIALVAVAGCSAGRDGANSPGAATAPSPSTGGSASSGPGATVVMPAGSVRVGPVSVVPPAGWRVIRESPGRGADPDSLCMAPAGNTSQVFGCAGIQFYWGGHLPGAETSTYRVNQADGWYHASDVEPCPVGQTNSGGNLNAVMPGGKPVVDELRSAGLHEADYDKWGASCRDGATFTPEAWYLPTAKVLVQDYLSHPETGPVLSSIRFASDGVDLPEEPETYIGTMKALSAETMTIQPFQEILNGRAGKRYAAAHSLGYPFPGGVYDAAYGDPIDVTIDGSTLCVGNTLVSGTSYPPSVVDCSAFGGHKNVPVRVWLDDDGRALQVSEQYRP